MGHVLGHCDVSTGICNRSLAARSLDFLSVSATRASLLSSCPGSTAHRILARSFSNASAVLRVRLLVRSDFTTSHPSLVSCGPSWDRTAARTESHSQEAVATWNLQGLCEKERRNTRTVITAAQ